MSKEVNCMPLKKFQSCIPPEIKTASLRQKWAEALHNPNKESLGDLEKVNAGRSKVAFVKNQVRTSFDTLTLPVATRFICALVQGRIRSDTLAAEDFPSLVESAGKRTLEHDVQKHIVENGNGLAFLCSLPEDLLEEKLSSNPLGLDDDGLLFRQSITKTPRALQLSGKEKDDFLRRQSIIIRRVNEVFRSDFGSALAKVTPSVDDNVRRVVGRFTMAPRE